MEAAHPYRFDCANRSNLKPPAGHWAELKALLLINNLRKEQLHPVPVMTALLAWLRRAFCKPDPKSTKRSSSWQNAPSLLALTNSSSHLI